MIERGYLMSYRQKIVSRLLEQLSPANVATAQLWVCEAVRLTNHDARVYLAKEGFTVAEGAIRRLANATEMIYYPYITDAARRLTGTLSLRELVTAQPEQTIGEIMTREAAFVHTDTDQKK